MNADQKADTVIIAGCVQPQGMPHVFEALKGLLDKFQISYTFLLKEYCCGWMPLGQPAVMAKNEEDIAEAKKLADGFIRENIAQAEALGAKSITLFCAACEPNYSNYKNATDLEVISYTELLDRHFTGGRLDLEADYYAGCYRFRRRITSVPLDVAPAKRVLDKIQGLRYNPLDNTRCCYIPPHLETLVGSIQSHDVITICTGCYYNLNRALKDKNGYRIKMLPELVWESVQGDA
jgi:hypothetical protein